MLLLQHKYVAIATSKDKGGLSARRIDQRKTGGGISAASRELQG